jgi:hypothetical protein
MFQTDNVFEKGEPWPPKTEVARIDRYTLENNIRSSSFSKVFTDRRSYVAGDPRTQVSYGPNYPLLATKKTTDALLYQPPQFVAELEESDSSLQVWLRENNILSLLQEAIWDISAHGHTVLRIDENTGKLLVVSPSAWIPVYDIDGSLYANIVWNTYKDGDKTALLARVCQDGIITYKHFELAGTLLGFTIGAPMEFDETVVQTRLPINNVQIIHNSKGTDSQLGVSDYTDDVIGLTKSLALRYKHRAEILDRHADPNIVGPLEYMVSDPITGEPLFKSGGRYFPYESSLEQKAPEMQYLTWDGQLAAVENEILDMTTVILRMLELPPAAMANETASAATSGTALRLQMAPLLTKAARWRTALDGVLPTTLRAALLQQGINTGEINIIWRDGLPVDPLEEASRLQVLVSSMIYSPEQALQELGHDDESIQQIITDSAAKVL